MLQSVMAPRAVPNRRAAAAMIPAERPVRAAARRELALANALPGHGVALGRIRADEKEAVGGIDVGVAAGGTVGAQRARVARRGRGHAEPGVRVEVVGAEEPLRELRGDVVLLGQELSRAVEGDGIRAVRRPDVPELIGHQAHRELPRNARQVGVAARSCLGIEEAVGRSEGRR